MRKDNEVNLSIDMVNLSLSKKSARANKFKKMTLEVNIRLTNLCVNYKGIKS